MPFKCVGRNPKKGRKKGGIKVHSVIHTNEAVPCDIRFTSAATHDTFMLTPSNFKQGNLTFDRVYIDYKKQEEQTDRNVVYVAKMKKGLKYDVLAGYMDMSLDGKMLFREEVVAFRKGETSHIARVVTYTDTKDRKHPKLVQLLTNDFNSPMEYIVAIYRKHWAIVLLHK